jgi:hypothetical protein
MDALQNKGRPGSTRYAHWVPGSRRRRQVRTIERFGTHDRSVLVGSSHYGTRTPNRLTSFTSGELTTSGSDRVAAAIFCVAARLRRLPHLPRRLSGQTLRHSVRQDQ